MGGPSGTMQRHPHSSRPVTRASGDPSLEWEGSSHRTPTWGFGGEHLTRVAVCRRCVLVSGRSQGSGTPSVCCMWLKDPNNLARCFNRKLNMKQSSQDSNEHHMEPQHCKGWAELALSLLICNCKLLSRPNWKEKKQNHSSDALGDITVPGEDVSTALGQSRAPLQGFFPTVVRPATLRKSLMLWLSL